jgi:hypothetical protein
MPLAIISSGFVVIICLLTTPPIPFTPLINPPVAAPKPPPIATSFTLSCIVPDSVGSINSDATPPFKPPKTKPAPLPTGKAGAIPPINLPTFLAVGSFFSLALFL